MNTYVELAAADVPTRQAAALTGVARATATRAASRARRPDPEPPSARPAPANKLSSVERSLPDSTKRIAGKAIAMRLTTSVIAAASAFSVLSFGTLLMP